MTYIPPAFPTHRNPQVGVEYDEDGMSLRDWFAGMAMKSDTLRARTDGERKLIAESAYAMADAMLKARDANEASLDGVMTP